MNNMTLEQHYHAITARSITKFDKQVVCNMFVNSLKEKTTWPWTKIRSLVEVIESGKATKEEKNLLRQTFLRFINNNI